MINQIVFSVIMITPVPSIVEVLKRRFDISVDEKVRKFFDMTLNYPLRSDQKYSVFLPTNDEYVQPGSVEVFFFQLL